MRHAEDSFGGRGAEDEGHTAGSRLEFRPGDWECPSCRNHVFARHDTCKCGTRRPEEVREDDRSGGIAEYRDWDRGGAKKKPSRSSDWVCPACHDLQFARNTECRKCGALKPESSHDENFDSHNTRREHGWDDRSSDGAKRKESRSGDWVCPDCQDLNFARNNQCRKCGLPKPGTDVEPREDRDVDSAAPKPSIRPGDWFCPACKDLQFSRNRECRKCGAPKPQELLEDNHIHDDIAEEKVAQEAPEEKAPGSRKLRLKPSRPGDWVCPKCQDLQFARNRECRKCGLPKPPENLSDGVQDDRGRDDRGRGRKNKWRRGDWECPTCKNHVWSFNRYCRRCKTPKPEGAGEDGTARNPAWRPGDWECPTCKDVQFARNRECRKCGTPKPEDLPDENDMAEEEGEAAADLEHLTEEYLAALKDGRPREACNEIHEQLMDIRDFLEARRQEVEPPTDEAPATSAEPGFRVFIGGLPKDCTAGELEQIVSQLPLSTPSAGRKLLECSVREGRGCGYISYASHSAAQEAIEELHDRQVQGWSEPLRAHWAAAKVATASSNSTGAPWRDNR